MYESFGRVGFSCTLPIPFVHMQLHFVNRQKLSEVNKNIN